MNTFDIIVIGGGWTGCGVAEAFLQAGKKVCVISDGLSLAVSGSDAPYSRLSALQKDGATILRGDRVLAGNWNGRRLVSVVTRNLGMQTPLSADIFVLATGKFFSRGLLSDKEHVWEPIFGSDVVSSPDRTRWYDPDFFAPQPFLGYGVLTDESGRILFGGEPAENLYASGEIVAEGYASAGIQKILTNYAG